MSDSRSESLRIFPYIFIYICQYRNLYLVYLFSIEQFWLHRITLFRSWSFCNPVTLHSTKNEFLYIKLCYLQRKLLKAVRQYDHLNFLLWRLISKPQKPNLWHLSHSYNMNKLLLQCHLPSTQRLIVTFFLIERLLHLSFQPEDNMEVLLL